MKITTEYQGDKRWQSTSTPLAVTMDIKKERGGLEEAPTPKELVLHGLAGCTGLDVVSILGKKKVDFKSFAIEVEAEQNSIHPVVFKTIKVHYKFQANPEDRKHFERAIELSETQFCGVSAMLAKTAEISWELTIEPID